MKSRRRNYLLPVLLLCLAACIAVIWGNSLTAPDKSMQASGQVALELQEVLSALQIPPAQRQFLVRKTAHFLEYAGLGFLWVLTLRAVNFPGKGRYSLAFCAVIAICDESLQLLSGRTGSLRDVGIDCLGAAAGIAVTLVLLEVTVKLQKKRGKLPSAGEKSRENFGNLPQKTD